MIIIYYWVCFFKEVLQKSTPDFDYDSLRYSNGIVACTRMLIEWVFFFFTRTSKLKRISTSLNKERNHLSLENGFLLSLQLWSWRGTLGKATHFGPKCLKSTKNVFTWCDFTIFSCEKASTNSYHFRFRSLHLIHIQNLSNCYRQYQASFDRFT